METTRTKIQSGDTLGETPSGGHIRDWEIEQRDGQTLHFRGELIGFATSQRDEHTAHVTAGAFALKGEKCAACRWFEVRIFRVHAEEDPPDSPPTITPLPYLVHTMGPTIVPGEVAFSRIGRAISGHEVIELLTMRRGKDVFLSPPSARAIAQAAGYDKRIEDAYVNRAVA